MTTPSGAFTDSMLASLKERFLQKVKKSPGCWLWIGAKGSNGYGQMQFGPRKQQAHRISYQFYIGTIPENLTLDHICRVRACVNPYHLRPMTMVENSRLGNPFTARKECIRGHAYTPENTRLYRGYRVCRSCKRYKDAIYKIKHADAISEKGKIRYAKNRDKRHAQDRARYWRNRDRILEQQRQYRLRSKGE